MDFLRFSGSRSSKMVMPDLEALAGVVGKMTEFDWYTGRLCETTHRQRGSDDATIHFGMLHVLKDALSIGLGDADQAKRLLEAKAAEGDDTLAWLLDLRSVASVVGDTAWSTIQARCEADGTPCIVDVTTVLVRTYEERHPRPTGRPFAGHYAALVDHVFAVGLYLGLEHPEPATLLADETFVE